jgi:protein gp37
MKFYDPLKWKEPRTIFTCSWSDFFIEEADPWRDEAFAIMALTPHHTYQVLTKRPDRMMEYLDDDEVRYRIAPKWPLPNIWLGVSVEDQKTADERIPLLLNTPAAVRWLSIEPLLGEIDILRYLDEEWPCFCGEISCDHLSIDWVVVGGESGHEARPMHPDWVRSIRDQCQAARVPFFFKQWGEWLPFTATAQPPFWLDSSTGEEYDAHGMNFFDKTGSGPGRWRGSKWMDPQEAVLYTLERGAADAMYLQVGKTKAGRLLDGREWNEMPKRVLDRRSAGGVIMLGISC